MLATELLQFAAKQVDRMDVPNTRQLDMDIGLFWHQFVGYDGLASCLKARRSYAMTTHARMR
jgi:hypothetical protein